MSGNKGEDRKTYVPPPQRILTSPDRIKRIRSIVCMDLPPHLNDREALKLYFSKYGRITRTTISQAKRTATLHFATHDMAVAAKQNGTLGQPESFKIFWSQNVGSTRRPSTSSSSASKLKVTKISPVLAKARTVTTPKSLQVDKDVEAELQAMVEASTDTVFAPRAKPSTGGFHQSRMDRFLQQPSTSVLKTARKSPEPSKPVVTSVPRPFAAGPSGSPAPPSTSSSVSSVGLSALQEVLRRPAFTTEERLAALEARDKLLRLRQERHVNLASAKRTVGTCEDMCPEKERYLREDRHQVSSYEQIQQPGGNVGICHGLAVKQYSRSSADQELPLPHELRPSATLRATMNHLLAHIVPRLDIPGESKGDWFFFLWDRTRAIRKDITQQELCDIDAVTLVEQCARFHVACSARLAGEELAVFDPKINTENLTKCLQTLKHLYHDMSAREQPCPNEPEFRAYVALLNLNSGDSMREVQELSPEVRASPHVCLAVQAYLALSHRNFVRFFRIVKTSGYLMSAVMIRYFTQARATALEILMKAMCFSQKVAVQYPLTELVRQLGFENSEDAAEFCERHGLETNLNSGTVSLSRLTFSYPETAVPLKRAAVVERQLTTSLAEVIAGSPLAEFSAAPLEPVSSFDSTTGLLTPRARELLGLKDIPAVQQQQQSVFTQPLFGQVAAPKVGGFSFKPSPVQVFTPAPVNTSVNLFALQSLASTVTQNVVNEVAASLTRDVAVGVLRDWNIAVSARNAANVCILQTISRSIREVCSEELEAAQREERARLQALEVQRLRVQRRQEFIRDMADQTVVSLVGMVTGEEIQKSIQEELKLREDIIRKAGETQRCLVTEMLASEVYTIAKIEIQEARKRRAEEIRELTERLLMKRTHRVLLKWREKALRARRLWERICDFPPAHSSSLSPAEQAFELGCHRVLHTPAYPRQPKLYKQPTTKSVVLQSIPLVNMASVASQLKPSSSFLSVPSFLLGGEPQATPPLWNVAVSLPQGDSYLQNWAHMCLGNPQYEQQDVMVHKSRRVFLKFHLSPDKEITPTLHGVALVIHPDNQRDAAQRLKQIFSHFPCDSSPAPVALLMLGAEGKGVGTEICDTLQSLGEKKALHHVRSFNLSPYPDAQHEMENALKWLAAKTSEPLQCFVFAPLSTIVASLLRTSVWHSVVVAALSPSQVGSALEALNKDPSACLKLANAQLQGLTNVLESSAMREVTCEVEQALLKISCPDFPFKSASIKSRTQVVKAVKDLRLPILRFNSSDDWPGVLSSLAIFCRTLLPVKQQAESVLSWISQQVVTLNSDGSCKPEDLPWPRFVESMLQESIACLLPMPAPMVIIPRSKLLSLVSSSWCSPDLISMLASLSSSRVLVSPTNASEEPTVIGRKRKLANICDKLDALMAGLADCKNKYSYLDQV